ncbi:S1C family serine protease [Streptantibioticus silvisoli]|uniref:Trypsin-like peptidase domain-containing protein n=1 Tax=Streptantibioticus silvisoli TaxID=2705255 RepID=A0ABT6W301_9ACTN|nr:trypsin-like peptidase domain-containing protein [Streptantibioticus silvisoli]MDI5963891.1 trypsin-like peptidase domain-containing protein [Streptantibioticus silvisoli]
MNEGKRARPHWWRRPQGARRGTAAPAGTPYGPAPATPPAEDAAPPAAPPDRPGPAPDAAEPAPDGRTGPAGPDVPNDPYAVTMPGEGVGGGPASGGWPPRPTAAGDGGRPPERHGTSRLLTGALAIAVLAGAAGGLTGALIERGDGRAGVSLPQAPAGSDTRAPGTVAGIAQATLPGVVYIHVKAGGEEATGTGIVLDTAGHILTNNHVVQPAASSGTIKVTLQNGSSRSASIVGRDTGYDLAVVKVGGVHGLKPLTLGNSATVRVGDPVIAIGAPYDLEGTVTSGIVSAKDRAITAAGDGGGSDVSYVDAIQTDAPINPGNSGGPLMNNRGEVIGVNSAIRSADTDGGGQGGSIGLGFAIPVNEARRVAQQLINSGHAVHPVVGVTVDMRYNGDGARIAATGAHGSPAVTPDGPGARAGLKAGDVITQVDGEQVTSGEELIVRTRSHLPGDTVRLTVERGGQTLHVRLTLGGSTGN